MKRIIALWAIIIALPVALTAQTRIIRGTVLDKSGNQPLNGVTVQASGVAASTDAGGNFSIAVSTNTLLTFSYIGYATQQAKADTLRESITVWLSATDNSLDAVVVTALGISKQKKSLGYATQELKAKDISEAKEANVVNALAGKIAGVRVTNTQGDMGSSRIVIRGETSIANNNQPLFIVDGVPVDNSQLGAGGSRDYRNAIADLNSEDIENISVLKGPNAAALYGSRAAHGVILIKTKTGKSRNGIGVTLNSNTTFSSVNILPGYQNVFGQGAEGKFSYVDGKGGGINDGVDESWGPKLDGRLIPQFYSNGVPVPFVAHPDNVKDYFKTGVLLSNSISLDGAGDKYNYRVSFNNEKQWGIVPNSEAGKNNVSFNGTFEVAPKLKLGVGANYIVTDAPNLPGAGGRRATSTMLQFTWFGRQVDINQLRNYKDANGNTFNWNNSYYSNPYWVAYENTVSQRRNRFIGNLNLTYDITDGLSFNFRTGSDYYNDKRKSKIAYGTNGTPFGSYQETNYIVNENNTEATLRYNREIGSDFTLDVLAGGNVRTKTYEENDQQAPRLAVAGVYTLTNSRDPLISSNYYSKLRVYSAYASAQLGYRNWAFLNLTARNDRSSTLPSQNLSYFYPSVNASVVLTDALDIKSNVLSFLKVRGGWSEVGADADPYQLINTYNFNAPYNGNPQLTTSGVDLNPNLKSESTNSTEIGIEAALFNNRVRIDASLYNTNSVDQILRVDVSSTTGYTQKLLNAGKINNKGIELQLGITPVKLKDFRWDIDLNYAANRSKLEYLDEAQTLKNYVLGTYRNLQVLATVGKAYGTLFGNAYLRDANGNIVVNNSGIPLASPTKKVLGKYTPDWIGGITNSFTYKQFNLSFLIDASIGGSLFAGTNSTGSYTGVLALTLPGRDADHGGLNYYYPNNDKSKGTVALPKGGAAPNGEAVYEDGMIYKGVTQAGAANTTIIPASQYYKASRNIEEEYVYSASYVKFRELKFGYNIPRNWIKKIGLTGATISLVGRNLWIIHKDVPNIDPETAFTSGNAQGLEDLTLPTTRSYGFNINVKF
ncbi:SusC/RagA family TonB-linked outer membrane protein [Paraflavitalea sp. CAU 1676]|uniref:SusC/RagA family TonB-linked outer membrane protein n=1 Tax=Paraflavitalea sp. CAU 1676 TaxID=3032598 RepID=UPI0023DC008D|nr:SusC/RagA family TonB-linked outer membrane protein [Paraflavitalea sp. CAU 1676]MDF2192344.1 SusC/RagA family TonB-linked outer membrane protein [Paraflavitalea sp. CAU 1676]